MTAESGFFGGGMVGLPTYLALLIFTGLALLFLIRTMLKHMKNPSSVDELRKRRVRLGEGSARRQQSRELERHSTRTESGPQESNEATSRRRADRPNSNPGSSPSAATTENPIGDENEEGVMGELCRARRRRAQREARRRERQLEREAEASDSDSQSNEARTPYRQRQLIREQREREQELQRRAERLAKKKAEEEEYQSWKAHFAVEEEGDVEVASEDSQTLLQQFLSYAKARKVFELDAIAADFGLKTNQVLNRIEELERLEFIDGVLDDRGRYICVEKAEWEAVASYINKAGRVNKSDDLVKECNRLIRLFPSQQDRAQFEQERTEALSRLVDFENASIEIKQRD